MTAFVGQTIDEILSQDRKFNDIPLRDISKISHPGRMSLQEFCETAHQWVDGMKEIWPQYAKSNEAFIEEFFEMMLAFNEVEQDPSYTR